MALEDRRLDIEPARQIAVEARRIAADQNLGPFFAADGEIGHDLVVLLLAGLRADHGGHVTRVALLDRLHPGDAARDEVLVDVFLDQGAAGAGANLALVEGEQDKAFDRLVKEGVIRGHHVGKEDVGRLATQFQRDGDQGGHGAASADLAARRG